MAGEKKTPHTTKDEPKKSEPKKTDLKKTDVRPVSAAKPAVKTVLKSKK